MSTTNITIKDVLTKMDSLEALALATVVRSISPTAAKIGSKAFIRLDGSIEGWIGGGCAQPAVIKTAIKCIRDGQPRLIRVSPESDKALTEGMTDYLSYCESGGSLDIFIEPLNTEQHLFVYGSSPAAESLVALAARTGFVVTVLSPNANTEMFPDATRCVSSFAIDEHAHYAVIATQGQGDKNALESAMRSDTPYIAMIASCKKGEALRKYLNERKIDRARIDGLICPAGIEIGAETPEEVALAVLASLVLHRKSRATMQCLSIDEKVEHKPTPDDSAKVASGGVESCCGSN